VINLPWVKELIEIVKRQRKHASFFEWPEKEIKEFGIVKCLFDSMKKKSGCPYYSLESFKDDPPDCIAKDVNGNKVAIEVSELVDLKSVRDAEHNRGTPKFWKIGEVIEDIQLIISNKEQKNFNGGPYKSHVLVIFTDEPLIDYDELATTLKNYQFNKSKQFNEIYLLISYDAHSKSYPYVKLNIKENLS
jgi:hypothetical protein